jgi:hypothetical protein
MKTLLTLLATAVLTAGCSGSSSSGSTSGQPHATPYAGIYEGVVNLRASAAGGSATDEVAYRYVVGVDGELTGYSPGQSGTGTCSETGKTYLSGNVAEGSVSGITCSSPELGSCSVEGEGRTVFNATSASTSGVWRYFCTNGVFSVEYSGLLKKVG